MTESAGTDERRTLRLSRRVEHVDTDAAGVVHFTRYLSLLETAVLENLDRLGTGALELARSGLDLAVTELTARYVAPARFLDQLVVDVDIDHVGAAFFRFSGTVARIDGPPEVLATGRLTFAVVDRAAGSATALPAQLSQILKECQNHVGI